MKKSKLDIWRGCPDSVLTNPSSSWSIKPAEVLGLEMEDICVGLQPSWGGHVTANAWETTGKNCPGKPSHSPVGQEMIINCCCKYTRARAHTHTHLQDSRVKINASVHETTESRVPKTGDLWQRCKAVPRRSDCLLNKCQRIYTRKEKERQFDLHLTPWIKINSKWIIIDWNIYSYSDERLQFRQKFPTPSA